MRAFLSFLNTVAAILLVLALLLSFVQLTVTDRSFFEREYISMDTAKNLSMSRNELMRVTDHLLKYMAGDEESLKIEARINGKSRTVFDERERLHMVDVAALYQNAMLFRNIAFLFVAIVVLMTALTFKKDRLQLFAQSYLTGLCVIGILLVIIIAWIAIDFNGFWTNFHYAFFSNDLWLLPAGSVMIQMFPEMFWFDVCSRIITHFLLANGVLFVLSVVYLAYRRQRRKRMAAISHD